MKVLVTGVAGFIGANLAAGLIADGHEVVGLDDLSDGRMANLDRVPELRLEVGDVRDVAILGRVAEGCAVIFHEAAKRSVERSIREPEVFDDVNVRGTLRVLQTARSVGARVVFASSSSVYGDQDVFPLHESMTPRPRSPYAASKVAAEAYCEAFTRSLGVPTVRLRYFNVYGPGMDPEGDYALLVPRLIAACLGGRPPEVHGDGEQARDFTYIDDVVRANLLAARSGPDAWGRAFNVGGGATPTSVNEMVALTAELTTTQLHPIHLPLRPGDVRRTHADISLAREVLGYRPEVAIREGIRRTVEHFRSVGLSGVAG